MTDDKASPLDQDQIQREIDNAFEIYADRITDEVGKVIEGKASMEDVQKARKEATANFCKACLILEGVCGKTAFMAALEQSMRRHFRPQGDGDSPQQGPGERSFAG